MAVCAVLGLRLVILGMAAPDFVAGGRPFLIERIPAGATLSQTFEVRDRGLDTLHLDAVGDSSSAGFIDALLYEVWNAGEREVYRASVDISSQARRCCTIEVGALENSRGREYRLELTPRHGSSESGLSLRARPVRGEGGLMLNGRPQRANLVLTANTPLARMKGEPRVSLWFLIACFLVIDAAVAYIIYVLWVGAPRDAGRPLL